MHPSALLPAELLKQCDVNRTRRSGPGGQNRNKVETAIVLTHRPTGIIAEASERRSQPQNQSVALFRLRLKLAVNVRTPIDPTTAPSAVWVSRRRGTKFHVNDEHEDFPTILAEALDHLAARDMDLKSTADHLGVSATQLVNLLKQHHPALQSLNAARAERSLPPLR